MGGIPHLYRIVEADQLHALRLTILNEEGIRRGGEYARDTIRAGRGSARAMLTRDSYQNLVASYRGSNVIEGLSSELVPLWCDDYYSQNAKAKLVQVDLDYAGTSFSYLFDIHLERTIGAFGVPVYASHARDASRMAGYPLPGGPKFHRGHLMAHSIGGGMDINLVPQLGKLNIGAFRVLERKVRDLARAHHSCLYFVRPIYTNKSQTPRLLEQGVVLPSKMLIYRLHKNS
jgi:hypothetical protein